MSPVRFNRTASCSPAAARACSSHRRAPTLRRSSASRWTSCSASRSSAFSLSKSWLRLIDAANAGFPRDVNPLPIESSRGAQFDGIVHRSRTEGVVVIELEPRQSSLVGFHPRMRASLRQLQAAGNLQELYDIAAAEVRTLTGFDRVMIYRFDRDWNGEVVAEARPRQSRTVPRPALSRRRHPGAGAAAVHAELAADHSGHRLPAVAARTDARSGEPAVRSISASPSCAASRRFTSSTCATWASPPRCRCRSSARTSWQA